MDENVKELGGLFVLQAKEMTREQVSRFVDDWRKNSHISGRPLIVIPENARISYEGKFDFGMALKLLKSGKKVARKGWNGKNMFIFLRKGRRIENVEPDAERVQGTGRNWFESRDHICMKDAEGKCVVGWVPSQTDMTTEDWVIVK